MMWAAFRGALPPDIAAAHACMHDAVMAVGSVFEMKTGGYKAVYSVVGQFVPTCDGPFVTLADAKRHIEFVAKTQIIRPRPVLLDSAFM